MLERKLMCLETFNNIYKALDQMRSSSVVPETETKEEMRQRVTKECKWFVQWQFTISAGKPPIVVFRPYPLCYCMSEKISLFFVMTFPCPSSEPFESRLSNFKT